MKSLIRGWRGILLLLFSILLASIIVFLCSSDFVIGTYLLEIVWSLVFFLFLLLCSRNHPVPILWMRGTDIKKVDTAAYCAQLKKPALVFALAVIIPNIVFISVGATAICRAVHPMVCCVSDGVFSSV